MSEKIAFASWNYIRLVCFLHNDEMVLDEINGKAVYRCRASGCDLKINASLYEKVLDDVIAFQNNGELLVGLSWKRKSESRVVVLTVTACANGKKPEIAVRIL